MDQSNPESNAGMKMVEKKSGLPVLAFGAVWLVYALLFPLYRLSHFILAGALSLVAFFLLNRAIPAKVVYVPDSTPRAATGNAEADALLKTGEGLLADIRRGRQDIEKQTVRDKIIGLEGLIARILAFLAENPEAHRDLNKFMGYYLPTLLKLVRSYQTFEAQAIGGENIGQAMGKIEDVLDTMHTAFSRQLDALFADTALDITTDITAMEGMLAQEGLRDDTNTLQF